MRTERPWPRRLAWGALAGVAGAAALAPADAVARRWLGRSPVFALRPVTRRLAARAFGSPPSPALVAWTAWPLRLAYGAGLGALLALARLHLLSGTATVSAMELWAMPAVGAAPPVSHWSRSELNLLPAHVAVFVATTRVLLRGLSVG